MSHDTSLVPVKFQGATLALIDHQGEPFVAMRPVVEAMGLSWQSQFDKIKDRYTATVREILTVAEDGKQRSMTCLPLRKLAGWLMTIYPNKVRPDLRERIIAYQDECDDALWAYWSQGHASRAATVQAPAEPAWPKLLPPDPLDDKAVRAAINRKAHALSIASFENNRDILEDWLRQSDDISDPEAAIERIHDLDLDHGKHVMVDIQLLWDLIGCAKSAHRAAEVQMLVVERIETATAPPRTHYAPS
jgi:hypothetical protein